MNGISMLMVEPKQITARSFSKHRMLTDNEKRKIYLSPFELGNPDPIGTTRDFYEYLTKYGGQDSYELVANIKKTN